ncbi:DUF397 domain-containing protein [Streptomyces sp. UNOC14_S4]|uniref:DUF397 domain-containing protein n=1 Tax=Streptomyces sp. UNOC14_S4 TaxID=2872340 RepID=UPI001E386A31|nr:DUF397 domain-containing protein [Streptomyces sp. UNOC14_S4]MCC3769611.1 DUF397 domain-containing protein [Streptomyces sp. UNOC14_S4]
MSGTLAPSITVWAKSSYSSGQGGQCLEWPSQTTPQHTPLPIRDSKHPQGPALTFPAHTWSSFVEALAEDRISTGRLSMNLP